MTLIPSLTFTDYEWFPWSICNGCGMPAGNAYPSGHLVPSPILGLANAPIVKTKFLELAMSLLDFSPRIPLGTFSIFLLPYIGYTITLCIQKVLLQHIFVYVNTDNHTYMSLTREGPYLIMGNKGKCQTCSLDFVCFSALKLNHPLLYDDDTLTHAAYCMKMTFLDQILDGRSWSYFDIYLAPFQHLNATLITPRLVILFPCDNDFWQIYTDFLVKI